MKHGNKRIESGGAGSRDQQQQDESPSSGNSTDIVSPTAVSNSTGSSNSSTGEDVRSSRDSSPIPYKRQILSPRVHPAFSPVTPATPDLMDIDLDELGEIAEMTHSWPSPGPLSPQWGKGKGKGSDDEMFGKGKGKGIDDVLFGKGKGKGKDDFDLIGKGKGQKGRGGKLDSAHASFDEETEPVHSSQQQTGSMKPPARRGKNLAVLARLQNNVQEIDFNNKPLLRDSQREHDSVSSSSDSRLSGAGGSSSRSGKPSPVSSGTGSPSFNNNNKTSPSNSPHQTAVSSSPLSAAATPGRKNDSLNTIDETILQEIQSIHHSGAGKVLEELAGNELEELAKTATDKELSAFVTRSLDLTIASQVWMIHCSSIRARLYLAFSCHYYAIYSVQDPQILQQPKISLLK